MRPAAALSETARMSVSVDLGTDDRGAGVGLDLAELLATRLLVQGNSGSGKSHLLRRLLEGSAGTVQQVVIDPEGDFVTLSDAFGHMVIDAASYSLGEVSTIAARIREHRASAVLSLEGLEIEPDKLATLLSVDTEALRAELPDLEAHFSRFGDRLPTRLRQQLEGLRRRLGAA